MSETTNPIPASADRPNQNATRRSARFSARVPSTGHGVGYSTISTPRAHRPASAAGPGPSPPAPPPSAASAPRHSCLRSNPQRHADQRGDPDDKGDDALRSGADPAEAVTTRVIVAVRHRLHVGDDVLLLLR